MKTFIIIIFIIIVSGALFIHTEPISYDGGFSGGEVYKKCSGIKYRLSMNNTEPDGISGKTYCIGLVKPINSY
jgi:hypothetical protein